MTLQYGADQVGHVKTKPKQSHECISNDRIASLELQAAKLLRILSDQERRIRKLSSDVNMLSGKTGN